VFVRAVIDCQDLPALHGKELAFEEVFYEGKQEPNGRVNYDQWVEDALASVPYDNEPGCDEDLAYECWRDRQAELADR
jgi:hypothetical protein